MRKFKIKVFDITQTKRGLKIGYHKVIATQYEIAPFLLQYTNKNGRIQFAYLNNHPEAKEIKKIKNVKV